MERRELIKLIGLGYLFPTWLFAEPKPKKPLLGQVLTKTIPSSGEKIPVIGMGTARTFNVGNSSQLRNARQQVLAKFFEMGGQLIDSSPMYGSSEEVVGYCLKKLEQPPKLISATKVWTASTKEGKLQFQKALKLWGQPKIDIYQVHNLIHWREHIEVLREYKEQKKIRYVGITTSHGRRLEDFANIIKTEKLDFIQFTYNLVERWNEDKLLNLARDRGIAVIINRPFQRGDLFKKVSGKTLPAWAREFGCKTWSEFFLKWVVSHPAVTCAIPATTRVDHMIENMGALQGPLPNSKMRAKMQQYFATL